MQTNEQNKKSKIAFEYAREILTNVASGVMTIIDDVMYL